MPRQNGRLFPDDIFKCFFLNVNVWIWLKISLKFVPKGRINNIPALVQIMAWRRPGDKSLSEPMMVNLLTHICIIRPQRGNAIYISKYIRISSQHEKHHLCITLQDGNLVWNSMAQAKITNVGWRIIENVNRHDENQFVFHVFFYIEHRFIFDPSISVIYFN